eukprot:GHVU01208280.1.p1 GENE.GHVU01208280.1~~GHVU01208280.1.p1  ORF type:complete len:841 (+),score=47.33 GHVU01208280.1:116-2524(+)
MPSTVDENDEIASYRWHREFGACEAFWRIAGYHLTELNPAVVRLPLHLPGQQAVIAVDSPGAMLAALQQNTTSMLQAWFLYNANMLANSSDVSRSHLPLYLEMPELCTWDISARKWRPRTVNLAFPTIGRLYHAHPSAGELFYLRLILMNDVSRGACSFTDLYTVNNILYPSFRQVCEVLGFVESTRYLHAVLSEAATYQMPSQLRDLFCIIMEHHNPPDIDVLFTTFSGSMTDDWNRRDRPISSDHCQILLWLDLQSQLRHRGKDIHYLGLAHYAPSRAQILHVTNLFPEFQRFRPSDIPPIIAQELSYDIPHLQASIADILPRLTNEQKDIYDYVWRLRTPDASTPHPLLPSATPRCVCILAAAGSGKTTLINLILDTFRADGRIALSVASTGIAASLLHGGLTFHSRFRCPLELSPDLRLRIKGHSSLAQLLRKCHIIIWDEISMAHRLWLEAPDICLRDLCRDSNNQPSKLPFGGKIILVAGDFRQTLPIDKSDNTHGVECIVKKTLLWQHFHVMRLTRNMRVQIRPGMEEADLGFLKWLQDLGDGSLQTTADADVPLPPGSSAEADDDAAIDFTYPLFLNNHLSESYLSTRLLMAPRHYIVRRLNEAISARLQSPPIVSVSFNIPDYDAGETLACITPELLNSLDPPNFPPHVLTLRVGMVVMLLRGLNNHKGMYNGRRMLIQHISRHPWLLRATFLEDPSVSVVIPRIKLACDKDYAGFTWYRTQFPVSPAYALTISKSQGQTVEHSGIHLEEPVFAHGMLYTSASRCRNPPNTRFFIPHHELHRTRNIVYHEVLE